MRYIVLDEKYSFDLGVKVEKLLKEGWELQGGVSSFCTTSNYHYTQALIKK